MRSQPCSSEVRCVFLILLLLLLVSLLRVLLMQLLMQLLLLLLLLVLLVLPVMLLLCVSCEGSWSMRLWRGTAHERVYLPQMCSINTEAMNSRLMTSTGTGPTLSPGESSV